MMNKCYHIGGIRFALESDVPIADNRFYSAFYEEGPCENGDYHIQVKCGSLPEREGEPVSQSEIGAFYGAGESQRFFSHYAQGDKMISFACRAWQGNNLLLTVDNRGQLWDSMLFYALNLPELLLRKEAVLFHCSYIIYQGQAILFSAPKGTGKSTQAALWAKYRGARVINGDRAVLRFQDDMLYAYGTPFCGSSGIAENETAPVRAVIFLKKGEENRLSALSPKEGFFRFAEQCSREYYQHDTVTDIALAVCNQVPFYELSCLPNQESVLLLERELWKTKTDT